MKGKAEIKIVYALGKNRKQDNPRMYSYPYLLIYLPENR